MKHLKTAAIVLIFWTVVLGGIYPLLMTGLGALFMPATWQVPPAPPLIPGGIVGESPGGHENVEKTGSGEILA